MKKSTLLTLLLGAGLLSVNPSFAMNENTSNLGEFNWGDDENTSNLQGWGEENTSNLKGWGEENTSNLKGWGEENTSNLEGWGDENTSNLEGWGDENTSNLEGWGDENTSSPSNFSFGNNPSSNKTSQTNTKTKVNLFGNTPPIENTTNVINTNPALTPSNEQITLKTEEDLFTNLNPFTSFGTNKFLSVSGLDPIEKKSPNNSELKKNNSEGNDFSEIISDNQPLILVKEEISKNVTDTTIANLDDRTDLACIDARVEGLQLFAQRFVDRLRGDFSH